MAKASGKSSIALIHELSELDRGVQNSFAKELIKNNSFSSVNEEDESKFPVIPFSGDFHYFPFRHLSATTVGRGGWKSTDFSNDSVLKDSAKLLEGKPAYLNHNISVGEDVGHVGEVTFKKGYTSTNGDKIPSGLEAAFVIDKVLQPKLVRKLSSPVSPIKSSSVTVFYEWEASHEFEEQSDFFYHLGEIIDGEEVRRIAGNILDYNESSMVWLGADPYAGMLDDKGQVVNIDKASLSANHPKNPFKENREYDSGKTYFVLDSLNEKHLTDLSRSTNSFSKKEVNKNKMEDKLVELLASKFGTTSEALKKGEFTIEMAKSFEIVEKESYNGIKGNAEAFEAIKTEKEVLSAEVTTLKGDNEKLSSENKTLTDEKATLEKHKEDNANFVEVGETALSYAKEQAVKYYKVFSGGKEEEVIISELESETNIDTLNKKIQMFGGKVADSFSGYCTACESSDNVQFRSSSENNNSEVNENNEEGSMADALRF